jgi:hypothetical protein
MSKELKKTGDLEIAEDLKFEKRQWTVERIGLLVMVAFIVAAILGAFGKGVFSKKIIEAADNSLSMEFDRFARLDAQTDLKLQVANKGSADPELRLWLDREYMSGFEVKEIYPEPERMDLNAGRTTFVYRVSKQDGPLLIHLILEPNEVGFFDGLAGLEGGDPISFRQFVYP